MVKIENLRIRIKKKFKSMRSFCRCNNIDPYEVQILFACERANPGKSDERTKRLNYLSELCKSSSPNEDPTIITSDLRAKIGEKIYSLGGVDKFSENNPEFRRTSIYQILDGRRKNVTKKVTRLIKHLGL